MNPADLIIGIDGGGSKTVAWLAPRGEPTESGVLGHGRSGSANMRTAGFETVAAHLDEAVDDAFRDAGIPRGRVESACLSLAGAGRDQEQAQLASWAANRNLATVVKVTNDALPVLWAGTPDRWGIALVSGTGSFAFGKDSTEATARCGGWGPLLDDAGSGYAIARAGLRAAVRFVERRGPETILLDRFMTVLRLEDPSEIIPAVYASGTCQQIARHARLVFDANREGDSVAASIIQNAAVELAELAFALSHRLAFTDAPTPLACAGGVLVNQPEFCARVAEELTARGLRCAPVTPVPDPVAGALLLADQSSS